MFTRTTLSWGTKVVTDNCFHTWGPCQEDYNSTNSFPRAFLGLKWRVLTLSGWSTWKAMYRKTFMPPPPPSILRLFRNPETKQKDTWPTTGNKLVLSGPGICPRAVRDACLPFNWYICYNSAESLPVQVKLFLINHCVLITLLIRMWISVSQNFGNLRMAEKVLVLFFPSSILSTAHFQHKRVQSLPTPHRSVNK